MQIRLALESDIDEVVAMARENITSTRPDMEWNEDRCRETFMNYLLTASPTIWVAVHDSGAVAGMLLGDWAEYRAADGLYVTQEVLFVKPAYRGSRAAPMLMKELVAWAELVGAKEIMGGVDNNFQPERTAKFLSHIGFERVGYVMRRVISHGFHGRRQEQRKQAS